MVSKNQGWKKPMVFKIFFNSFLVLIVFYGFMVFRFKYTQEVKNSQKTRLHEVYCMILYCSKIRAQSQKGMYSLIKK